MKSDIQITRETRVLNIKDIAKKANISEKYLELYGNYKAKVSLDIFSDLKNKDSKLLQSA